eukprot:5280154-Ditylum_brightwellii.AAC.1
MELVSLVMATSSIDQQVKRIVGLDDNNVAILTGTGITNKGDLLFLQFMDFKTKILVGKQRKLELVIKYLALDGATLSATALIGKIQKE